MKELCKPIKDKKDPTSFVFNCNGLIVFPPSSSKILDNNHYYTVEFEIRKNKNGKSYGVAKDVEIFHPFTVIQQQNKTSLSVQKFSDHYTITLSNITVKVEECKVCHLKRTKEIPESITADIVASDEGDKISYSPYKDDNIITAYSVIKYLNENNIKLEPNIRYNRVENIIVPDDVTHLEIEKINEIPADVNAYSYDARKFVHLYEEKKEYQNGDEKYIDITKYYNDGSEKRMVTIETYKEVYEYTPTFYSSYEDNNAEDYAKVEKLVHVKNFENVVKVNAMFLNMHREKAMKFKALYKALINAGYRVTITRSNNNKKVRVEKGNEYGEVSMYSEFATGYYAALAKQIYDLTF
ncbi:MAG: hypothetical protein RXR43_16750 [Sulfolobus sp.]